MPVPTAKGGLLLVLIVVLAIAIFAGPAWLAAMFGVFVGGLIAETAP